MNNFSPWNFDAPKFKEFKGFLECDVAVVGGGIAGITCAYQLSQAGYKVAVFDANRVGRGETLNSTAMVNAAQDLIYDKLITEHGETVARAYLERSIDALNGIEKIVAAENINCGFERCDSYIYTQKESNLHLLYLEQQAYKKLGLEVEILNEPELSFAAKAALRVKNQARFNPYKYVHGLAGAILNSGGQIFENTRITEAPEGQSLKWDGNEVKAKYFVIATHFPFINSSGMYFLKMYQHQSYNIAFESGEVLKHNYMSAEEQGLEFRGAREEGFNIAGGCNVRSGKNHQIGYYDEVLGRLNESFSTVKEVGRFSAQDVMTFDNLPVVGRYGLARDNMFVITGFNKWGMASSHISANIIKDIITSAERGEEAKIKNIFSPQRFTPLASLPKAAGHICQAVASWFTSLTSVDAASVNDIALGEAAIVREAGERLGVYRSESGEVFKVNAICPHLKCSLKWNKDEKSWDCPCHGSRFDVRGNILSGPSVERLEIRG